MTNDIIDGIAAALNGAFGVDYTIYKENVPQGFKEPCFSIVLVKNEIVPHLKGQYLLKHHFDIHYFPAKGYRQNTELFDVSGRLLFTLEYIKVLDILFRGTKMSSEIVDDVLHFRISYERFIGTETAQNLMETLTLNSKVEV